MGMLLDPALCIEAFGSIPMTLDDGPPYWFEVELYGIRLDPILLPLKPMPIEP